MKAGNEKRPDCVGSQGAKETEQGNAPKVADHHVERNGNLITERVTLAEAVAVAAREGRSCLLCRHPATYHGVFVPSEPRLWPGPRVTPGKVRAFAYGLCRTCVRRKDRVTAVEDAILASCMGTATVH